MYKVVTPKSDTEFEAYFHFRWAHLRQPWNFPPGSEKDEYEQVAEHRTIVNGKGEIVACGRVHLNTAEEAQIRHIAVHPDHLRKGLGQMIMDALENVAKELGAIRAVTNSREVSIDFFSSCGFVVEREAPNELGMLRRQQMVKKLTENNTLVLHPKWCKSLQQTWTDTIPITEHMGIKLYQYTGRTLETRASLNKNINVHGTMFAGSIFSLATLTGWGMIYLQLKERGLTGDIVLGDGDIHYHKPITMKPRAICNIETLSGKFKPLEKGEKARFALNVDILDGDNAVAEFEGVFWVLPEQTEA
ncbi:MULTISPECIES: bifunctional GNAT family N-acetyltransferase/hotdog fold thioesterase [Alteromonas]|uniref:Acetyltransferase n=1 Tax=Alteromonas stellipolaris TaxID=233316 RepID=A0AAW7Z5P4_9ALTE|nr:MULTISPECIES: bifunctional GNAT family N-acetyltransferase/hotdog fold thioesterase [Alteromonas]AMJ92136.1 acetyltransferase [Alteromonas sp. Mac2]MBQ4831201.1 YiiD C-terminal domain-containing protein [Alteromonas sp. MMG017]ALM92949.1 galactoside O-acetyltransferase, YiiD [Alteromonas stellipolaris LMG 21856]AMJ75854.1 acetyltransferase [Alteromonas stellipolaris]AMJ88280.1 acetyltransferase [Alteromonas sp. Mac1]